MLVNHTNERRWQWTNLTLPLISKDSWDGQSNWLTD